MGLEIPKYCWKEDYFSQTKIENNSIEIIIGGKIPLEPPIFIENVYFIPFEDHIVENNNESYLFVDRSLWKSFDETSEEFFVLKIPAVSPTGTKTEGKILVEYKDFLKLPNYVFSLKEGKEAHPFVFEVDPFLPAMVPPKRKEEGAGSLLQALKKFPGVNFLHKQDEP